MLGKALIYCRYENLVLSVKTAFFNFIEPKKTIKN